MKQKATLSDQCGNFAVNISDDYIGILLFGWANNTASAEINLSLLQKISKIIIAIKAIATYENSNCKNNYKKARRIYI